MVKIERISIPMLLVLRVLLTDSERRRYAGSIARAARLDPRTVGKILRRLENSGLAWSQREELTAHQLGREPRRYFELTDSGRSWAGAVLARPARS
jgi:DNA-binding MarR family transcriptional regulator